MIRLGANLFQMRSFRDHDLLFSRLRLLAVMARAYLANIDLGFWQSRAMRHNADDLAGFLPNWSDLLENYGTDRQRFGVQLDHIFYQRVKLLMIIIKSLAEGNPMGIHRRFALKNNLDYVCETLDHMHPRPCPNLQVVK